MPEDVVTLRRRKEMHGVLERLDVRHGRSLQSAIRATRRRHVATRDPRVGQMCNVPEADDNRALTSRRSSLAEATAPFRDPPVTVPLLRAFSLSGWQIVGEPEVLLGQRL